MKSIFKYLLLLIIVVCVFSFETCYSENNSQIIENSAKTSRYITISDMDFDPVEKYFEYCKYDGRYDEYIFTTFRGIIKEGLPYENTDMERIYGESYYIRYYKSYRDSITSKIKTIRKTFIKETDKSNQHKIAFVYCGLDTTFYESKIIKHFIEKGIDTVEIVKKLWYVGRDELHDSREYQEMSYLKVRDCRTNDSIADSLIAIDGSIRNTYNWRFE